MALSRRSSLLILSALARPPLSPPRRPNSTANGSFPSGSDPSASTWRITSNAIWFTSRSGGRSDWRFADLCFAGLRARFLDFVGLRDGLGIPQYRTPGTRRTAGQVKSDFKLMHYLILKTVDFFDGIGFNVHYLLTWAFFQQRASPAYADLSRFCTCRWRQLKRRKQIGRSRNAHH